jgi:hypothetical protein
MPERRADPGAHANLGEGADFDADHRYSVRGEALVPRVVDGTPGWLGLNGVVDQSTAVDGLAAVSIAVVGGDECHVSAE